MPHTRTSQPLRPYGLAVLALLAAASAGWGKVVYVNKNAPGAVHDGASWSTACLTVTAGLAAATSGDEVWVAKGAYVENVTLRAAVRVYGGFAGTEAATSQRDCKTNITVLDGNKDDVVTSAAQGAVLDGFTVRNGGTGINVNSGAATVTNCMITGNSVGIDMEGGAAIVSNCTISGSSARGIYVYNATITVANCTISGSSADGITVRAGSGTKTVTNCTISGNGSYGIYASSSTSVTNCVVAFNGTGIYQYTGTMTLSHNDVYGNAMGDYSNITDPTGTNGNISQDPKLSNIYHNHIQPESPCINTGDDSMVHSEWTDIDGQPRIIGAHVDIGSDEADGTTWSIPSRTWYVSPTGNDANAGSSWTKARTTVTGALGAAQGTDEVWVAKGVYKENVLIPAGVALYGGFAGTETHKIQRDWKTNTTAIDGNGDPTSVVVKSLFLDAVLDGFTLRNGNYGFLANGSWASITNCTISGNKYGIYAYVSVSVGNCTISGNSTTGITLNDGFPSVTNCVISGNSSSGIFAQNCQATVANCTISGSNNGVKVNGGSVSVNDCTISGNSTGVLGTSSTSVTNCVVAFNGTGIYQYTGTMTLSHNCVFGNTSANYTNITNPTGTNGNISGDPLFVSRGGGDYHLNAGSPCINAGNDSAVTPGDKDLDGKPRKIGAHVDIGAYEYGSVYFSFPDAATALKIAGGLLKASTADQTRLNVDAGSPRVDFRDAVRIARKAAGLEPNP